jgi:DGQHR domain-containing protein
VSIDPHLLDSGLFLKTAMTAADIAKSILAGQEQERDALRLLLSRFALPDTLLVQRCQMAGSVSFVGAVTLQWLSDRVAYANQLPLFSKKLDETGSVLIDDETISLVQQRPLDWSRQGPLAQYLAASKHHKFPPVLVVAHRAWVDEPGACQWRDGIAQEAVTEYFPLSADGRFGYIRVPTDVMLYALDGQHRLMGVQGLIELVRMHILPRRKRDGYVIPRQQITVGHLEKEFGITLTQLQERQNEQIGVEIISAVDVAESREEARQRVRSIFVHVNRMASPLTKGQLAQLDEDDGYAIVARQVAVDHPFLRKREGRTNLRVNWKNSTISGNATVFTTLQTMKEMAASLLRKTFPNWEPREAGLVPLRPEEKELEAGKKLFGEFFSQLQQLPTLARLDHDADTPTLRRFRDEKKPGQGHFLFRPVGQQALAEAVADLLHEFDQPIAVTFSKLAVWDAEGGLAHIDDPSSVFFGVIYDPIKKRIIVAGRDLARRLLIYMLAPSVLETMRDELREELEAARTLGDFVLGFSGENAAPGSIKLPAPIAALRPTERS